MLRHGVLRPIVSFVRQISQRASSSKVAIDSHKPSVFPDQPAPSIIDESKLPNLPEVTDDLIHHLEQLSLVRFSDEAAVHHLVTAVRYAQRLAQIDTEGIRPMHTVLEDSALRVREDEPGEAVERKVILSNAVKSVENMYFVAPVGNVPLEERQDKLGAKEIKEIASALKRS